jgi:NAD(P)-dependent dehydrogenase (short-subunit alcohol dehydrogenase family)
MSGKTVIITGANGGIGRETTLALAKCGARIIMACRNLTTAEQVKSKYVLFNPYSIRMEDFLYL